MNSYIITTNVLFGKVKFPEVIVSSKDTLDGTL